MYYSVMAIREVSETNIGVYLWEMPDGSLVSDDEGRRMYIQAKRGDLKRIAAITDAARSYGIVEGRPLFVEQVRPVSDEEFEEQRQRMLFGLVPDVQDSYSQLDDLRHGKLDS